MKIVTNIGVSRSSFIQIIYYIIDNLRNGLETQAKVYGTFVIRFTLKPCNFTLNTFQDLQTYLHFLNKNSNVNATIDFSER